MDYKKENEQLYSVASTDKNLDQQKSWQKTKDFLKSTTSVGLSVLTLLTAGLGALGVSKIADATFDFINYYLEPENIKNLHLIDNYTKIKVDLPNGTYYNMGSYLYTNEGGEVVCVINEFDKQAADVRALPYTLLGADPLIPAQTYVALTNNFSNVEFYSEHRDCGKFEVSFLNLANGTIRDGIINEGKAEFLDSPESTTQIEIEK